MLQRNLQPATSHLIMVEAGSFCKPSVHINKTTWRYIPESCNLRTNCHENFNPLISLHQIYRILGPNQLSTQFKTGILSQGILQTGD
jgi:hypothetical protein